ncbi:MAG: flagellar assembly protein FliW [Lachnospiraceae bacterium]|jgi:flagellar assembly factor FliW|nr:flagellar assembly protein FliW [Lachnospiraceae bacterium]
MIIVTKNFDEIEIDDDKIIQFPAGIIGFPNLTDFALIHDDEKGTGSVHWLQSIQEPAFAMPVMDPLIVCQEYNPVIDDEVFAPIGSLVDNEMLILVTLTVPRKIEEMSVNLRAPIIINATAKKACQVILEDNRYAIKFPIYDILNQGKEGE